LAKTCFVIFDIFDYILSLMEQVCFCLLVEPLE